MDQESHPLFSGPRWPPLLLALAALLVALPGLFMGLHADDWTHLKPRSAEKIAATFTGDWNDGARGGGGFLRPMVRLPFALDDVLHGGSAAGSHLTNGLLFLALSLSVYLCALVLAGGRRFPAFLSVLVLYILNPLRSEALYWVSGRTDLLAALFLFAALALALLSMERGRLSLGLISLGALALGLLSKESAIAGCAIIPLAVVLLGGSDPRRLHRWLLLAGPIILGLVYLLHRRIVLGGLGGYETDEPREVWSFLRHGAMALSALFCPWQADSPGVYRPLLALPGLAVLLVATPARAVPRGLVFAAGALLLSLIPISFIAATPLDGSRVLVLPMGFLAMGVAVLLPRQVSTRRTRVLLLGALVFLGSLMPMQASIWHQFITAREPNARLIAEAAEWLDGIATSLPADGRAGIVVPEPPRSEPRRILDPGLAMIMALETHWLRTPGSAASSFEDPPGGRFGLVFERGERTLTVVPALTPWLGGEVHRLRFPGPEKVAFARLARLGGGEVSAPGARESITPLPEAEDVLTASLVFEGSAAPPPLLMLRHADGGEDVVSGERTPLRGHHLVLATVEGNALDGLVSAELMVPEERPSLRLRTAQWALYRPGGDE